jgi:hypothetical protein
VLLMSKPRMQTLGALAQELGTIGSGTMPGTCEICGRPAARKDARRAMASERTKCERCSKAIQRTGHATPDVREQLTPYERALEAWKVHLDASAEDDLEYHRTRVRALQASRAWALTDEPCGGCAGARAAA